MWNEDALNASKQPDLAFYNFFIPLRLFVFVQVSIFISVGSISKTVGRDVGADNLIFILPITCNERRAGWLLLLPLHMQCNGEKVRHYRPI